VRKGGGIMKQSIFFGIALIVILFICASTIFVDNVQKYNLLKEYKLKAGTYELKDEYPSNNSNEIILDNKIVDIKETV
jgi:hypothetical protein